MMMNVKKKTSMLAKKAEVQMKQTYDLIRSPRFRFSAEHKIKKTTIGIIRGFIIFGLCFVVIYPIMQMMVAALSDLRDLNDPLVVWLPRRISFQTIQISATAIDYWFALRNTFIMSFGVMLITVISTSLAGYSFARLRFKGINILFIFVVFTIVVPPQTIAMPLFMIFNFFKLTSTFWPLFILAATGMGIKAGIFIFIFNQVFRNLPKELEEAAIVDGCGVFRTFYNVMLPNAKSAIVTVMLFSFVWQWNDIFYSQLLISTQFMDLLSLNIVEIAPRLTYTLYKLGIDQNVAEGMSRNPLVVGTIANTAAILMLFPLLVGYIFVQRLFVESVERVGIVG
jgi:multiple sugar transport system permease protein